MKFTVYTYELEIGEAYTVRNKYHHEYEYGTRYYAGKVTDKWGDEAYLFSDKPVPKDVDASSANIGGELYTKDDIDGYGCICK